MAQITHKKNTESKYVSVFADSRPDIDITFRDVLLSRPTDHYVVGVDNFTMTNTSLSMIEPMKNVPLIRIVRRLAPVAGAGALRTNATDLQAALLAHPRQYTDMVVTDFGANLQISSEELILNVQQLMFRLGELAADVNKYMFQTWTNDAIYEYDGFTADPNDPDPDHLSFDLNAEGTITINGSSAFWSCFLIEIPSAQYQFCFYGPRDNIATDYTRRRRFLSVDPLSGEPSFAKVQTDAVGNAIYIVATPKTLHEQGTFNVYNGANANNDILFKCKANTLSSLERRIALEIGCSLPIKNSPMVDHEKETPDFTIARWIYKTNPRLIANDQGGSRRYEGNTPGCVEYQGAQDRVTYHELQAQAKIQTFRIKLFARIRAFNERTEQWSMRIINVPTEMTDWWHARIHFMSKD